MTRRQGHGKAHEVPRAVCTVQGEGAALLCRGLVRGFGSGKARVRALDGVTVSLARGTVTGLVGPDGAGKTTLLRIAAGLLVPDEGEMTVLGHDAVRDPLAIQSRIGYMPQRFGLYEDLTVAENLTLYADLQGVTYEARKRRWPHLMRLTGLAPFMDRLAGRLSGGMKQKLGLACTLVKSPDMLLLDEPTVGVDPLSRRELWNIVHGLVREDGITVLVSTAYLDEAEMCDRVLVLAGGRVLGDAQPADYLKGLAGCAFAVAPDGRPPPARCSTDCTVCRACWMRRCGTAACTCCARRPGLWRVYRVTARSCPVRYVSRTVSWPSSDAAGPTARRHLLPTPQGRGRTSPMSHPPRPTSLVLLVRQARRVGWQGESEGQGRTCWRGGMTFVRSHLHPSETEMGPRRRHRALWCWHPLGMTR